MVWPFRQRKRKKKIPNSPTAYLLAKSTRGSEFFAHSDDAKSTGSADNNHTSSSLSQSGGPSPLPSGEINTSREKLELETAADPAAAAALEKNQTIEFQSQPSASTPIGTHLERVTPLITVTPPSDGQARRRSSTTEERRIRAEERLQALEELDTQRRQARRSRDDAQERVDALRLRLQAAQEHHRQAIAAWNAEVSDTAAVLQQQEDEMQRITELVASQAKEHESQREQRAVRVAELRARIETFYKTLQDTLDIGTKDSLQGLATRIEKEITLIQQDIADLEQCVSTVSKQRHDHIGTLKSELQQLRATAQLACSQCSPA